MGFIKVNEANAKEKPSTLIFGDLATGKTTAAYNIVKDNSPLFIVFGGAEVLNQYPGIVYWEYPTIDEFNKEILAPIVSGSAGFKQYGAIVLDGLFEYAQAYLTHIGGVDGVLQKHWGIMSKEVTDTLVKLRRARPVFVTTVLTQLNATNPAIRETTLNPELHKRSTGLFYNKQYCARITRNGQVNYTVQTNSALALDFKPYNPAEAKA